MTSNFECIIYEKKPPVAYLTLNRPEKLNALSKQLQLETREALEDAGWQDKEIKVIVIKAAGRAFSAGFDISNPRKLDVVQWRESLLKGKGFDGTAFWDVFWNNPKPLIAQIHGFCLGGGLAIANFCDLRVCSDDTLFGYPIVRDSGPYPTALWPWLLGMTKVRELMYTGNLMDAHEAFRVGLVTKVVPKDKLDEEVNRYARTMSKVPAVAIEYSKKIVNMAYEMMNIRQVLERGGELEAMTYSASDESNPERAEFQKIQQEKGLKAALDWRANKFAEEDAWWRTRPAKKS